MSHRATVKRIMRESKDMIANPANGIIAHPLDNVFEWHFTIAGVSETEFEGGRYHGKIILPSEYPFKPPDIIMLTKSGRFEIGKKICLNFSGFHPEQWQPSWTIRTMLVALRAFMVTPAAGAIGAMETSHQLRKHYAKLSLNYKCPKCNSNMKTLKFQKMDDKNDKKVKESLDMRKKKIKENSKENNKKNTKKIRKNENENQSENDDTDNSDESSEEDSLDLANVSDSDEDEINITTAKKSTNDLNSQDSNSNENGNESPDSNSNSDNTDFNNNHNNNNNNINNNNRNVNRNRNRLQRSASGSSRSSMSSTRNTSTKNKMLDFLTFALLIAIVGILFKKFAVRFAEQL